jgi:hypothetical protein
MNTWILLSRKNNLLAEYLMGHNTWDLRAHIHKNNLTKIIK